jgi:hypothetical protein
MLIALDAKNNIGFMNESIIKPCKRPNYHSPVFAKDVIMWCYHGS